MKQNISTLMDGELYGDEAEILLGKIKRHPEAQQEWMAYHLIGDVLRQPDYIPRTMGEGFYARLQAEPTVLAPHTQRSSKAGFIAMSAVASIMAMALIAWLSVQIDNEPAPQRAAQRSMDLRTVNIPLNDGMNGYLLAHQEFSPATDVRGAASYLRTVAFDQSGAGQ